MEEIDSNKIEKVSKLRVSEFVSSKAIIPNYFIKI